MKYIHKLLSYIFSSDNSEMKESVRENIVSVLDNRKDTENISKQERLMLRNVL